MAFAAPSLKGRALRYLAQREHSRVELERKLARHAEDSAEASAAEQIAAALDALQADGLLNEARVAESVLAHGAPRFGARRLRQTMQSKGLAPELIAQTLEQARGSELERALELWRRRFGSAPADASERARQMRFLAGRGFEAELIRRVVPPAGAGTDTDASDFAADLE
ncbi:recombination regulator RecX [Rubrivivax gelatinosus]|uniref:Regulatory protein RecX n=1 Tax=Rubrivivax gelatinosus TaxID=28068 RepID=A0ABS1DSP2_RUBGE|nr:recombination regulator RecX [Rubrivivax gelatinosus]MBK1713037.1 recombination regulator RecX [Rubrivivax gelatinosus]